MVVGSLGMQMEHLISKVMSYEISTFAEINLGDVPLNCVIKKRYNDAYK